MNKNKITNYLFRIILVVSLIFSLNLRETNKSVAYLPTEGKVLGISTIKARGSQDSSEENFEIKKESSPDFSKITAKSFLVFEESSGQDIESNNIQEKLPIASLTKLMTGLIAYENLDLNNLVKVENSFKELTKPILYLEKGDMIKPYDLISSMMVGSANNVAYILANLVAKSTNSNFVELMNEKAKNLSMLDSKFSNPAGFDSESNYSTASDIKKLVLETQKKFLFQSLGKLKKYEFVDSENKTHSIKATNKLVFKNNQVETIKTGFTNEAGGSLVVKFKNGEKKIIVIVLGSADREGDAVQIAEQIFKSYIW